MPAKTDHIRVSAGDVLEWRTWGGGGYGDLLKRDPDTVTLEVARGLVTLDGARPGYGVVVSSPPPNKTGKQLYPQRRHGRDGNSQEEVGRSETEREFEVRGPDFQPRRCMGGAEGELQGRERRGAAEVALGSPHARPAHRPAACERVDGEAWDAVQSVRRINPVEAGE